MGEIKKIKGLVVRTINHLACVALFFAFAYFVGLFWPITKPYAIFCAAITSFFFGAMWDGGIFGLRPRNCLTFLAEVVILLIVFLLSAVDHLFSLEIIPGIWRALSLWPSLIGAIFSFVFFLFFREYYDGYNPKEASRTDRQQPV